MWILRYMQGLSLEGRFNVSISPPPHLRQNRLYCQCTWPGKFPLKEKAQGHIFPTVSSSWANTANYTLSTLCKAMQSSGWTSLPRLHLCKFSISFFKVSTHLLTLQDLEMQSQLKMRYVFCHTQTWLAVKEWYIFLSARLTPTPHSHFPGCRPKTCYAATLYTLLIISFTENRVGFSLSRSSAFCHWYLGWN